LESIIFLCCVCRMVVLGLSKWAKTFDLETNILYLCNGHTSQCISFSSFSSIANPRDLGKQTQCNPIGEIFLFGVWHSLTNALSILGWVKAYGIPKQIITRDVFLYILGIGLALWLGIAHFLLSVIRFQNYQHSNIIISYVWVHKLCFSNNLTVCIYKKHSKTNYN